MHNIILALLLIPITTFAADEQRFDVCVLSALSAATQKFGIALDSLTVSDRRRSPVSDPGGERYEVQLTSKLDRVYQASMLLAGGACTPVSLIEDFAAEESLRKDRQRAAPRCHCAHTYQDLDGGIGFTLIRCVVDPKTDIKVCKDLRNWRDRNWSGRPLENCRATAIYNKETCPIFDAEVERTGCMAGLSHCDR